MEGQVNVGETLLALRKERNLTLKDVSEKVNLSISYLSAIERGQKTPDVEKLSQICDAYGAPAYLILLKAGIEENVPLENRKLVRELKPVLKKMKAMLEDLYYDNDDDDDTDGLHGIKLPTDNLKKVSGAPDTNRSREMNKALIAEPC